MKKRMLSLIIVLGMIISVFNYMPIDSEAASQVYYPIDLSAGVSSSRILSKNGTDCALVSVATIESYMYGTTSTADKNTMYNAVVNKNLGTTSGLPNTAAVQNWDKLGYRVDASFTLQEIYDQLAKGYPVIVHRTASGSKVEHWSVVCAYTGSTSVLQESGFTVIDIEDLSTYKMSLTKWKGSSTLDRYAWRRLGIPVTNLSGVRIAINTPKVIHPTGGSHGVYGYITSSSNLTNVVVQIVNLSTGKYVFNKSIAPNAKSYSMFNLDSSMTFASYGAGEYYYMVYAQDENGNKNTKVKYFKISSSWPSTEPCPTYTFSYNSENAPATMEGVDTYKINEKFTLRKSAEFVFEDETEAEKYKFKNWTVERSDGKIYTKGYHWQTPEAIEKNGYEIYTYSDNTTGLLNWYWLCNSTEFVDYTFNAVWEYCGVSVSGVVLDRTEITMAKGESMMLNATVAPDNATNKDVIWASSDANVVTVDDGKITAVGKGSANVSVTTVDGEKSATCVVTVTDTFDEEAYLTVGSINTKQGETVTVPINIGENPGIAGFNIKISYDNTVFTPVCVEKGSILTSGTLTSNVQQGGDLASLTYVSAFWSNPYDITANGEMLLVTFSVADDAEKGAYPISVNYNVGDVTNQNYEDIGFVITNGVIEITDIIPGDIYADGTVNTKDSVRIGQFLAGWDIELSAYELSAADVYTDGAVNTKDSVKLSQILAGWNFEYASLMDAETEKITFRVESAKAVDGYVDIPVIIDENDGVAGFNIKMNYDNNVLTPVSITRGDLFNNVGSFTSNLDQGGELNRFEYVSAFWSNPTNVIDTGVAFTVRFKVNKDITTDTMIKLEYTEGDICNQDYNELEVTLVDGVVIADTVQDYTLNTLEGVVIDGSFYAEAEIIKNTGRDAVDTIIIAVYKDNVLIDRIYMRSKFAQGQIVVFGGYLEGVEGATLKAFVWDSMTGMNTLSNVMEK